MVRQCVIVLAALAAAVGGWSQRGQAEELRLGLPEATKFVVRVDFAAIQESTVGGRLVAALKDEVLSELENEGDGDGLNLDKIVEIVGFDPFQEVQGLAVAGADYEEPEQGLVACLQLRKTTGNLEGLLLTLPGYSSETVNGREIHSAKPDDETTLYCAFHADDDGNQSILAAAERDSLLALVNTLEGKSGGDDAAKSVTLGQEDSPLVTVDVFELPEDLVEDEGPPANVAKIVNSISVRVSEADNNVVVSISLVADTDKQAEQLEQAVKGLGAMVSLAASGEADDEDLQMVQQVLSNLDASRDGATLELKLSMKAEQLLALVEENVLDK